MTQPLIHVRGARCPLGALHEVREEELGEHASHAYPAMAYPEVSGAVSLRKKSLGSELAGLELAPAKPVGVRVRLAYEQVQQVTAVEGGGAAPGRST